MNAPVKETAPKIDTAALLARVDIVDVIDRYVPLKKSGVEYEACCPFHTEKSPSFKVSPSKQIFQCFGCGEHGDAIAFLRKHQGLSFIEACNALGAGDLPATGVSPTPSQREPSLPAEDREAWRVLMPVPADAGEPHAAHIRRGKPDMRWEYRDANGQTLGYVYRFRTSSGGKETLPHVFVESADGKRREWRWLSFPQPRPLYGLDRLAAAAPDATVLVVEGEKCADAAHEAVGDLYAVVSWPGGGKAVKKADWLPLSGRKVLIWPDCDAKREPLTKAEREAGVAQDSKPLLPENDQPGMVAAHAIAEQLGPLGCKVDLVKIPAPGDKPDGWDVADLLQMDGGTRENVLQMLSVTASQPAPEAPVPAAPADASPPVVDEAELSEEERLQRDVERMLTRYSLIHGKRRVWDNYVKMDMSLPALKDSVGKVRLDAWLNHDDRRTTLPSDVAALKRQAQGQQAEADDSFMSTIGRYVYLDGSDNIWDGKLRRIISSSAAKMAMGDGFKLWQNSPNRRVVPFENLVFDPTQRVDPTTHINQFRGLPLTPAGDKSGCTAILQLSYHLCGGRNDVWWWLMNWIAHPLQHVGAKMASAVLMHGDVHGSGKSFFWEECVKPIFGDYGTTLGQHQLESNYTAWRSKKLFGLFEEVVAGNQKYSHTGVLKHMITGKTQTIERKFVDAWEEANHMNMVFLSNAIQPFHVEAADRRYMVIWPEKKMPESLQSAVEIEVENGGVEAFYNYLLSLPLTVDGKPDGDPFGPHTKPLMTPEKRRLIDYGLSGWELFHQEWSSDLLEVPFCSCLSKDLVKVYRRWCRESGENELSANKFSNAMSTKVPKATRWYRPLGANRVQATIFKVGQCPDDMSEENWLAIQLRDFRLAATAYGALGDDN